MSETQIFTYKTNHDVVLREEDNSGALLFNPDTNDVKVLNHTGLMIWKGCQSEAPLSALIERVRDHYDNIPDTIDQDISLFLAGLEQSGFIFRTND